MKTKSGGSQRQSCLCLLAAGGTRNSETLGTAGNSTSKLGVNNGKEGDNFGGGSEKFIRKFHQISYFMKTRIKAYFLLFPYYVAEYVCSRKVYTFCSQLLRMGFLKFVHD